MDLKKCKQLITFKNQTKTALMTSVKKFAADPSLVSKFGQQELQSIMILDITLPFLATVTCIYAPDTKLPVAEKTNSTLHPSGNFLSVEGKKVKGLRHGDFYDF